MAAVALGLTGCTTGSEKANLSNSIRQDPALSEPISPQAASADLKAWITWLTQTHPDLAYTTDLAVLEETAQSVNDELAKAETLRDAWSSMARLNPVFDDAHTGLRLPQSHFDAWIESGGFAFPADVTVHNRMLYLAASGEEIAAINQEAPAEFLDWILTRIRGEDASIRERVISLKFPLAYWTFAGGAEEYHLKLKTSEGVSRELNLTAPSLPDDEETADEEFALTILGNTAVLRIDTFEIGRAEEFASFLQLGFARIAESKSQRLVIDLRSNGGGARELSNSLMEYLTHKTFSAFSAVTARITAENQRLVSGSSIGEVVRIPFTQPVKPKEELQDRFEGDVWILVGPDTYSQAIAFAATSQDEKVARIAGLPTSGRANQTGQVQMHRLRNTGFNVQSPIYIFTRKSGHVSSAPLMPDLILENSEDAPITDILEQLTFVGTR
ncbi:S41 family peptidase [Altererythrobacter sp. MF3-039]|uniref:S41 family peptidase n=1 Tax=Altererythrobacter sp. MF3-039 TaxID=3252901 RepID=UPI00390CD1FC